MRRKERAEERKARIARAELMTPWAIKAEDLEIGCAELVQIAIEKGSADNVSCMVIEL